MKQVFISYRHESADHARAVRLLAERLRQANLPIALDQFLMDEKPGGPDEGGWPKWCEDCASLSECVLIVASRGWFAAYNKSEAQPRVGLGAATEADIFRQDLYDEKGRNARIRIVMLHDIDEDAIPVRLRPWHRFQPFAGEEQFAQLVKWISSRLGLQSIQLTSVSWPAPILFQPELANRNKKEWPAVVDLLAGRMNERILLVGGDGGMGKSELVRQAAKYAKTLGISVAFVNLKGGVDVSGILGQIDLDLGAQLPNFTRDASKTHLLRKDLRALRRPVLIIVDHFEDAAGNRIVVDWLCQQLLADVEASLCLAVIIAGRKVPDPNETAWRSFARPVRLEPIKDPLDWELWVANKYPQLRDKGHYLPVVLRLTDGNPLYVVAACEKLARA